jgi:hypothetical protein
VFALTQTRALSDGACVHTRNKAHSAGVFAPNLTKMPSAGAFDSRTPGFLFQRGAGGLSSSPASRFLVKISA